MLGIKTKNIGFWLPQVFTLLCPLNFFLFKSKNNLAYFFEPYFFLGGWRSCVRFMHLLHLIRLGYKYFMTPCLNKLTEPEPRTHSEIQVHLFNKSRDCCAKKCFWIFRPSLIYCVLMNLTSDYWNITKSWVKASIMNHSVFALFITDLTNRFSLIKKISKQVASESRTWAPGTEPNR